MSERAVVETAKDEEAVQEWLGTTLARMGGGRFRCDRETQVAANRRPDITVTATQVQVQVAIEGKAQREGMDDAEPQVRARDPAVGAIPLSG